MHGCVSMHVKFKDCQNHSGGERENRAGAVFVGGECNTIQRIESYRQVSYFSDMWLQMHIHFKICFISYISLYVNFTSVLEGNCFIKANFNAQIVFQGWADMLKPRVPLIQEARRKPGN